MYLPLNVLIYVSLIEAGEILLTAKASNLALRTTWYIVQQEKAAGTDSRQQREQAQSGDVRRCRNYTAVTARHSVLPGGRLHHMQTSKLRGIY